MASTPHRRQSVHTEEDLDLVRRAQKADQAEHALGIREALSKYKKAVGWSLFLSLALVVRPSVPRGWLTADGRLWRCRRESPLFLGGGG